MSLRDAMVTSWFLPESFYQADRAYPDQADFICPQAFGRNTYSDEKVGKAVSIGDHNVSVITRFGDLKARGFDPGGPNRLLARRSIQLAKGLNSSIWKTYHHIPVETMPIIGQWEVLYAMWLYEPDWYAKHQDVLIPIWPPITGKWTTHAMMLTAKEIARAHELKTPLLVAHPEHIERCFFITSKIFSAAATDRGAQDGTTLEKWFDQHSVQKQTRSPGRWLRYEMLARIHHRFHGWM